MGSQEIDKEAGGFTTANRQSTTGNNTIKQCSSCGSTKRRSLFTLSLLQEEPNSKKPNLRPQPPTASSQYHHLLEGFKKLQIPAATLRRTISEPIPQSVMPNSSAAATAPFSPESLWDKTSPAKLSVPPPILRRTISEPIPQPIMTNSSAAAEVPPFSPEAFYDINSPAKLSVPPAILQRIISTPAPAILSHSPERNNAKIVVPATATETPPSLPPLRPILRPRKVPDRMSSGKIRTDSIIEENPFFKELKKMKDIFRVMSQRFGQVVEEVLEEEEEEEEEEKEEKEGTNYNINTENRKKDDPEPENENVDEEAVSVGRTGECLTIQFNCPCSKDYSVLLSEDACYYKLM